MTLWEISAEWNIRKDKYTYGIISSFYVWEENKLVRDRYITYNSVYVSPEVFKDAPKTLKHMIKEAKRTVQEKHMQEMRKLMLTKKLIDVDFVKHYFPSAKGTTIILE